MNLRPYLIPFEYLKSSSVQMLVIGQAVLLFAFWCLDPISSFPSPLQILAAWDDMAKNQGLLPELFKSATTIGISIIWSTLIAGSIMMLSTSLFFKHPARWLTTLRFLGFSGITYFFTLWTSSGGELKIWMLTFGMTVFLLTAMLKISDSLSLEEIDYFRTLKLKGWRITWEGVIRGKLDEILDAIRQNAAMGWMLLSMIEGLVMSEGGIGAILLKQNKHLHLAAIFAIQITILVYGILQDIFLHWVRYQACPYLKYSEQK